MEKILDRDNRQYLMGIAIMLITLHHLALYGSGFPFSLFIGGSIGVDIFFFLSIIGCCYSLEKRNVVDFYKRRALRIYPMYVLFLVVLLAFFYGDASIIDRLSLFCLQITGLSIFKGFEILAWYIPSTIALYLFMPLIFVSVKKLSSARFFYLLQLLGLWIILLIENRLSLYITGALAYRLPILYLGLLTYLNLKNESRLFGIYVLSALLAFFMPHILMRAALVLPLVLYGISKVGLPSFGRDFIFFLGRHSLEIYLGQYIAVGTLFANRSYAVITENLHIQIVLSLVVNSILAFCLYAFSKFITSHIR